MFYVRHARPGSSDRAISFLERAVQADPSFALGHATLSSQYMSRFFYVEADPALEQKAVVAVEKALANDPDLAEGYLARAQLVWTLPNRFPHERAVRDLKPRSRSTRAWPQRIASWARCTCTWDCSKKRSRRTAARCS